MTDEKTLQLFLYSMKTYDKFAASLPINKELRVLENRLPQEAIVNGISDDDFIGINVRLMLQRKYTQQSERLHIPKILAAAKRVSPSNSDRYDKLLADYKHIGTQPFEITMPDGEIDSSLFHAVHDLTYGVLLHADEDKIARLSQVPKSMRMAFTCKYVIEVDELLSAIQAELVNDGQQPYSIDEHGGAVSIYWGSTDGRSRAISNSPYWKNLIGHDLALDDLLAAVPNMSKDDMKVFLVCLSFVNLLEEEDLNVDALKKLVAPWTIKDWGDFSDASNELKKYSIGMSLEIKYGDDGRTAIVKLLPNVDEPFSITEPQMIEGGSMTLVRFFGNWKVLNVTQLA